MDDYRSKAEIFVTRFLDYVQVYDIKDFFNKSTQTMERSPGIQALITEAESVFPTRVISGKTVTDAIDAEVVEELINTSPNVIDSREVFSRKIKDAGAARGLLERVIAGDMEAIELAKEFIKAENGEKEFQ